MLMPPLATWYPFDQTFLDWNSSKEEEQVKIGLGFGPLEPPPPSRVLAGLGDSAPEKWRFRARFVALPRFFMA